MAVFWGVVLSFCNCYFVSRGGLYSQTRVCLCVELGVGSEDCWGLAEPPPHLAQKGVPSCLGPPTPHRFRRASSDEYS